MNGVEELASRARAWFPAAFEDVNATDSLPLGPEFQHAFCGLLTLADWIGSDSGSFPYASSSDEDRIGFSRKRAEAVMLSIGIDTSSALASLSSGVPLFTAMFDWPARPLQDAIEDLPIPDEGTVAVLEAETGSGKTEAAIRYFLRLFQAGRVDGLYFALPTRSSAVQIHERVVKAIRKALGDKAPPVVLAVPGYLKVDEKTDWKPERVAGEAFIPLPKFDVLWPDNSPERYRYRGWAAENPKRYLAAPVAVGTVDQVLLSGLQVRHAHLRGASLLRHLLVVDEVHASDQYMTVLLDLVLKRHMAAGGQALLMSATLGSAARARYLSSGRTEMPSPEEAVRVPYPVLTVTGGDGRTEVVRFKPGPKREVHVEIVASDGVEPLVRRAAEAASSGARVLILRNLVNDAVKTQRAVEATLGTGNPHFFRCEEVVTLHHGRFAAEDRKALDVAVEARFGEKSNQIGGAILVSTQTIEQSLDIDFDLILTDLCPMDVMLQRIGRLHRHAKRTRPSGFDIARIHVIVPAERDLSKVIAQKGQGRGRARGERGLGTVYPDLRILEATWRLLERTPVLKLPRMNRKLVEAATHPERLDRLVAKLGDVWAGHANRMEGARIAEGGLANLNAIRWDVPFGEIDSLFADEGRTTNEVAQDIRTRLGERDRLARFADPVESPFRLSLSTIRIPGWMSKAEPDEVEATVVEQHDGVISFRYGPDAYEYDRFGLRRTDV
jgi:CRISPR-associated endonuclease/helicase Cas3